MSLFSVRAATGDYVHDIVLRGPDVHSIVADPLFITPAHCGFTRKPGSPAARIDSQPIGLSQAARRRE